MLTVTLVPDAADAGLANPPLSWVAAPKDLGEILESYAAADGGTISASGVASRYDLIPIFASPHFYGSDLTRVFTASTGRWGEAIWTRKSDRAVLSGAALPSDAILVIPTGITVTLDTATTDTSTSWNGRARVIEVDGTLKFSARTANAQLDHLTLSVDTLEVMPSGTLALDTTSPQGKAKTFEIVFAGADQASSHLWSEELILDPQQFGHGLLNFGNLQLSGNQGRSVTWGELNTSLNTSSGVTTVDVALPAGTDLQRWIGQQIVITDSREMMTGIGTRALWHDPRAAGHTDSPAIAASPFASVYTETRTVAAAQQLSGTASQSQDPLLTTVWRLTLDKSLEHAHPGMTSTIDPTKSFHANVGLLSSDLIIRSADVRMNPNEIRSGGAGFLADPSGISHRGHVLIAGAGEVSITGTEFLDLGRTDMALRDWYYATGSDLILSADGTTTGMGAYSGRKLPGSVQTIRALNNVSVAARVTENANGTPTSANVSPVLRAGGGVKTEQDQGWFATQTISTLGNRTEQDYLSHVLRGTSSSTLLMPEYNQVGRYAIHFHHYQGPSRSSTYTGFQFVFDSNEIVNSMKWAMALHDTSFGDVSNNVIFNAQAVGIMGESGAEVDHLISRNLIVEVRGGAPETGRGGTDPQANLSDLARTGDGMWFRRPGSRIEGNVVADAQTSGFYFNSFSMENLSQDLPWVPAVNPAASTATNRVRFRGLDPQEMIRFWTTAYRGDTQHTIDWETDPPIPQNGAGQYLWDQLYRSPKGTFDNNVVYGMVQRGFWANMLDGGSGVGDNHVSTRLGDMTPDTQQLPAQPFIARNFVVWGAAANAITVYYSPNFLLENPTFLYLPYDPLVPNPYAKKLEGHMGWARADVGMRIANAGSLNIAINFGSQYNIRGGFVVAGGIIEGFGYGMQNPWGGDNSTYFAGSWQPVRENWTDQGTDIGSVIQGGITLRSLGTAANAPRLRMSNWVNVGIHQFAEFIGLSHLTLWADNVDFRNFNAQFPTTLASGISYVVASYKQAMLPGQALTLVGTSFYSLPQADVATLRDENQNLTHTRPIQIFVTRYTPSLPASSRPAVEKDFQLFFYEQDIQAGLPSRSSETALAFPISDPAILTTAGGTNGPRLGYPNLPGATSDTVRLYTAQQAWQYFGIAPNAQLAPVDTTVWNNATAPLLIGLRRSFPGFSSNLTGAGSTWTTGTIAPSERIEILTPWDNTVVAAGQAVQTRYVLRGSLQPNEQVYYSFDGGTPRPFDFRTLSTTQVGQHSFALWIQNVSTKSVVPGTLKTVYYSVGSSLSVTSIIGIGPGSLQAAVDALNQLPASSGPMTIAFNFNPGTYSMLLTSDLVLNRKASFWTPPGVTIQFFTFTGNVLRFTELSKFGAGTLSMMTDSVGSKFTLLSGALQQVNRIAATLTVLDGQLI